MVSNVLLTGCDAIQEWRYGTPSHYDGPGAIHAIVRLRALFERGLGLPFFDAFWRSSRFLRRPHIPWRPTQRSFQRCFKHVLRAAYAAASVCFG